MDKNSHDIGHILQQARKSRGFTQAEVAPQLGVSRATVAQIDGRDTVVEENTVGEGVFLCEGVLGNAVVVEELVDFHGSITKKSPAFSAGLRVG